MTSCSTTKSTTPSAGSSCCGQTVRFDGASKAYRRILAAVIAINLVGFVVVAVGSLVAQSTTLAANSLDFAADAATYGLSLWVIGRSVAARTNAAFIKSASLALLAASVVGIAVWRLVSGAEPEGFAISGAGLFGIAANLLAALLLLRYRDGDANVRSVWLCTRNDVIQCIAVAFTGLVVSLTGSRWPDLIVGVFLAVIFLRSAWQITLQAREERSAAGAAA
ncbi:cation transporter [Caulobacter segnis]|uniref:cation transporter n=1 Tax=Caulobacter segnis TaxID=88688 RepID=UPI00240FA246|nr:cation transporter [Caulobacter segnis]MDG2522130.1 cation transporter [Caulobacter segnis]